MKDEAIAQSLVESIHKDKDLMTDVDFMSNPQAIKLINDVLTNDLTRAERVALCRAACVMDVLTVTFGERAGV